MKTLPCCAQSAGRHLHASLQAEDALKSAIAEFEDQGVDLSNIIKSVEGGSTLNE